jgi:hypothetical protein
MNGKLAAMAALAAGLAMASQARARPYLMLTADEQGFKALDLGDIHQEGIDTAQVTLISAPLAGARVGDKVAALMKERLEFECQGERWRVLSVGYADAKDVALASDPAASAWRPVAADPLLESSKDAACLRRYKQTLVSRNLNLGDIVSNYHKAWGPAAPEPLTREQLLKQRFDANH